MQQIKVLGLDISRLNRTAQVAIISVLMLLFFTANGYFLESIFIQPALKPYALYVLFLQFSLYSIFAYVELVLSGQHTKRRISMRLHNLFALLQVTTVGLSASSLQYLNYPTQVIFKSCKLIPMLVGGIVIQGKRYGANDFLAATLMCVGLIWFTLVDVTVSPNFHPFGVGMISIALLADVMISNTQEKVLKENGASNSEVVFYSFSIGLFYLGFALVATGQLVPAIQVAQQHALHVYGYGFLLSVTGYLGLNILLTLLRVAGAFAVVTLTTCRKALSITVSFLAFPKPFSMQYVWSGLLILMGLHWNLLVKSNPDWMAEARNYFVRKTQNLARLVLSIRPSLKDPPAHLRDWTILNSVEEGRQTLESIPRRHQLEAKARKAKTLSHNPQRLQRKMKKILERRPVLLKVPSATIAKKHVTDIDKVLEEFQQRAKHPVNFRRGI